MAGYKVVLQKDSEGRRLLGSSKWLSVRTRELRRQLQCLCLWKDRHTERQAEHLLVRVWSSRDVSILSQGKSVGEGQGPGGENLRC